MKKYFMAFIMIVIFPIVFPIAVHAKNQYANLEEFQDKLYEVEGFRLADNDELVVFWKNNPDKVLFLGRRSSGAATQACFGTDLYVEQNQNTYNIKNHDAYIYSLYSTGSNSYQPPSYYWDGWNYNYGLYDGIEGVVIDFDSVYYSPQIPVPTIDVYMASDINNPSSGQAVWNASMEFGDNSQYYIQYGYKSSFPSYIDVGLSSLRGDFSYNYYNYTSTNYIDIVPLNSLTSAVNQSKPASYFQDAWQSFYDNYLTKSLLPEFGTQVNAMSTSMLDDAKDYYIDYMLGQIPMYGNRLEVFARYFIIDEENDNRVVVGAWNHWSSKDGSKTKERPSNYIDNVALPGYINSSNNVNLQDESTSIDNEGSSTGVPSTVINNNYVPNYPDYPTIASYNKDNLLVSTIGKMSEIKGFFGEFNDFLLTTFVWVPDWIWGLIGLGFGLSIIVFFLRML